MATRTQTRSQSAAAGKNSSSAPLSRQYLIGYNGLSFLLWASLLGRISILVYLTGFSSIYPSSGLFAQGVQTLAILEIFHSVFGVVRAPVMTTAMQVASRLLLVWGIVGMFGDALLTGKDNVPIGKRVSNIGIASPTDMGRNQIAYFFMLVAWSVTECVRYLYFVFFLNGGGDPKAVPSWLQFLRYNTFYVLYPMGISCECWLVYSSLAFADRWNPMYGYALRAILAIYVPGSYILFTHMMTQRNKVMNPKKVKK